MKNIVEILLIGIIMFFASCKDRKKSTQMAHPIIMVAENVTVSSVNKTVSPFDTLNILDLDILLSFQKENRGHLFENILPYNLSSEIRLVRNELFARKGYIFQDTLLRDYFILKKWYSPKYSSLDSIVMTFDEKAFIDTLVRYEKLNAGLTRKSFQQLFLNEYLMKSDNSGRGALLHWSLWTQAIDKNQQKKMPTAPWDYESGSHHFTLVDKPYGYYHCILNYWGGAEGSGSETYQIYVLDKKLDVLCAQSFYGYFSFEKVADNKYKYSVSEGADHQEAPTEVESGFYEISKEGLIQVLDH